MSQSRGRDLKPPVDGMFMKFLGLEPFLGTIILKTKLMHGNPMCHQGLCQLLLTKSEDLRA